MSSGTTQVKLQENWMRVALANKICTTNALLNLLHEELGFTKNPKILHKLFTDLKGRKQQTLSRIIKAHQWDIFCHDCSANCTTPCPKEGVTKLKDFDITNLAIIYRNLKNILPNMDKKKVSDFLNTYLSFVDRACGIRNFLMHSSAEPMKRAVFYDKWNEIRIVLSGLDYCEMKLFNELKTCSLDPLTGEKFNVLQNQYKCVTQKIEEMDDIKCNRDELNTLKTVVAGLENQMKNYPQEQCQHFIEMKHDFEKRLTASRQLSKQNSEEIESIKKGNQ